MTAAVWSADEVAARGFRFGHPLDPDAEATLHPLSRLAGFERTGVNLVRIAPGRRAFPRHSHRLEEEWVYVVAGEAEVTLGERAHRLGAGGFVAFLPAGPAHCVANAGEAELVCLMGGENRPLDVIDFPDQGRRVLRGARGSEICEAQAMAPFDFFSRTPLPEAGE